MNKILISFVFFASLAHAETSVEEAAERIGATEVKEISFAKNVTKLTEKQKDEIKKAVNEAAKNGKIEEVKVLTWSDKPVVAEKKSKNKYEISVADNRAHDLKAYLKEDLKIPHVDTYNMTQQPDALEKFVSRSEEEVIAESADAGEAPESTVSFDSKEQASKGVVMIFVKK